MIRKINTFKSFIMTVLNDESVIGFIHSAHRVIGVRKCSLVRMSCSVNGDSGQDHTIREHIFSGYYLIMNGLCLEYDMKRQIPRRTFIPYRIRNIVCLTWCEKNSSWTAFSWTNMKVASNKYMHVWVYVYVYEEKGSLCWVSIRSSSYWKTKVN